MKHVVQLNVTIPSHEHVSLRNRVHVKSHIVEASSAEEAINRASKQFKNLGYNVQSATIMQEDASIEAPSETISVQNDTPVTEEAGDSMDTCADKTDGGAKKLPADIRGIIARAKARKEIDKFSKDNKPSPQAGTLAAQRLNKEGFWYNQPYEPTFGDVADGKVNPPVKNRIQPDQIGNNMLTPEQELDLARRTWGDGDPELKTIKHGDAVTSSLAGYDNTTPYMVDHIMSSKFGDKLIATLRDMNGAKQPGWHQLDKHLTKVGDYPFYKLGESADDTTRHPLEGHPYHNKSNEELRYISKDAAEAARAMKDAGNESAESKYLDQVNDAQTVLGFRNRMLTRTLGKYHLPDWYTNRYYNKRPSMQESSENLVEFTISDVMNAMKTHLGEVDTAAIQQLKKVSGGRVTRDDLETVGHGKLPIKHIKEQAKTLQEISQDLARRYTQAKVGQIAHNDEPVTPDQFNKNVTDLGRAHDRVVGNVPTTDVPVVANKDLDMDVNDKSWNVRAKAAAHPDANEDHLRTLGDDSDWYIRYLTAQHPNTPPDVLAKLSNDSDSDVADEAAKRTHGNTPPITEAMKKLQGYTGADGRKAVVYKDTEWNDHIVKYFDKDGVRNPHADSHHYEDKEDAHNTAKHYCGINEDSIYEDAKSKAEKVLSIVRKGKGKKDQKSNVNEINTEPTLDHTLNIGVSGGEQNAKI